MVKSSSVSQKSSRFSVLRSLCSAQVFIFIALIIWIAHFWHFESFGLYEDDLWRIPRAMGMTGSEFWDYISNLFLSFGEQGRPLHPGLIYTFSILGSKLGGLHTVYLVGYAIITVNSFLFYVLLRRLSPYKIFAVTGALAFTLFPADTTKIFLTHSLGVQPSLTFLLLALHCYLSEKKKLSYLVIFGSLICYETVFPVFLAAPLLKKKWDLRLRRELFRHTLILAIMIVLVVIIRQIVGESRVSDLDLLTSILQPIRQICIGPIVSLKMFFYRPLKTLQIIFLDNPIKTWGTLNWGLVFFLTLCFAGLVWLLSQLKPNLSENSRNFKTFFSSQVVRREMPEFFQPLAKLAVVGLVMLVLAYPLTFTVPATAISGRSSRVHFAAVVGASILLACLCTTIFFVASIYRKKNLFTTLLATFFALLVGFGLIVQQDYKLAWQYQREFWSDIVRLCPDITDGTVILVEPSGLSNPEQIWAHSWALPAVLNQIYQFPDDWKIPPRVYRLDQNWQNRIGSNGNLLSLKRAVMEYYPFINPQHKDLTVESSNVILLDAKNRRMTRRTEPLSIGNQNSILKEISTSEVSLLEKGSLYDYLIRSSDEESVNYIR